MTRELRNRKHHLGDRKKRRRSRPLFLEQLEARRLLAVYVVDEYLYCYPPPGPCEIRGSLSLSEAAEMANTNPGADTIQFDVPGAYVVHETAQITESVTIQGFPRDIFHESGGRIFSFGGPGENTYTIKGLRSLAAGAPEGTGGIEFVDEDDTLTINNSVIAENVANAGGGIYAVGGTLNINNSTIRDNFTENGGGGGVYARNSAVTIRDSVISNNGASYSILISGAYSGGGLLLDGGTLHMSNSTVADNFAAAGGGLWLRDVQATLVNTTVTSNEGRAEIIGAGGIRTSGPAGHLSIINSTIVNNFAFHGPQVHADSVFEFENSIFSIAAAGGPRWNIDGAESDLISLGHNIADDDTGNLTAVGDMPNTDPLLEDDLADNGGPTPTHALMQGSPAIDAGADLSGQGVTTDQRGVARPYGFAYDIGAFEAQFDFDYGDAPDDAGAPRYPTLWGNDGARHVVGSLYLGAEVDAELDGQPTSLADGDDNTGANDDDGVFIIAEMVATTDEATSASFEIVASEAGKLDAWIDFNQNDVFDHPDEHLGGGTSIDLIAGSQILPFAVPAGAEAGQTFARFRISADGGLLPSATAGYGEVEDYLFTTLDGEMANGANPVINLPRNVAGYLEIQTESRVYVALDGSQLFDAPGRAVNILNVVGTNQDDTFGIHNLPSDSEGKVIVDGRAGEDAIHLTGSGQVIDLTTAGNIQLAQLEMIDLTGSGANTLTIDAQSVIDVTGDANVLAVKCDIDETINLGDGWLLSGTRVIDGEFYRVVEQDNAMLLLNGPASWQNPLDPLDVNASNSKEPLDVLLIVNQLNNRRYVDSFGQLIDPAQVTFPGFYYDTSGDGFSSPLDALLIINFLNARRGQMESEGSAGDLAVTDASSDQHGDIAAAVDQLFAQDDGMLASIGPAARIVPVDAEGEGTQQTLAIDHSIDASGVLTVNWTKVGDETAHHVRVKNLDTGQFVFQAWVYHQQLQLSITPGNYSLEVAAPGDPYARREISWPRIDYTIDPSGVLTANWTKVGDETAHHVRVKNLDTGQFVFQAWVYDQRLQLNITPGNYLLKVAAPSDPYARLEINFRWQDSLLGWAASEIKYEYLEPGQADVSWDAAPGAEAYFVRIRNSDGAMVQEFLTHGLGFHLDLAPDVYTVEVAAEGTQSSISATVDVADFTRQRYVPLSPIGTTDRNSLDFTWLPTPGAQTYFFQIRRNTDLRLIHQYYVAGLRTHVEELPEGDYRWRVIPANARNEQVTNPPWTPLRVAGSPLDRENVLGIEPDLAVPAYLQRFNFPSAAVKRSDGVIFVAEGQSSVIRRIESGQSSIYAGTLRSEYNGDGFRLDVSFNKPTAMTFDEDENLLVLDAENYLLRRIDRETGMVATLVGMPGVAKLPAEGAPLDQATLGYASSMTWDREGNLYIGVDVRSGQPVDSRVIVLTGDGLIHLHPAVPEGQGIIRDLSVTDEYLDVLQDRELKRFYSDGQVASVSLPSDYGKGLVALADGRALVGNHTALYVVDDSLQVLPVSPGIDFANISWIEVLPSGFMVVDGDRGAVVELDEEFRFIPGTAIGGVGFRAVDSPIRIAPYDDDTLLILENKRGYIFSYSRSTGRVEVFAGNGRQEPAKLGVDIRETGFFYPGGLAVDSKQNVYVSENHRIIKLSKDGQTSLYAGGQIAGDEGDGGLATSATFRSIRGLQVDGQDNLYVADTYNNRIRRIAPDGIVQTIAGNGQRGLPAFGVAATASPLNHPQGVLLMPDGRLLIADSWNNTIVSLELDGTLSLFAGVPQEGASQASGDFGGDGGPAVQGFLNTPTKLALDPDGALIFADTFNQRIRAVAPDGTLSTVWGSRQGYQSDGSLLNYPSAVFVDAESIYIADSGNGLISKIRRSDVVEP